MTIGKFVVFGGLDQTGKSTQSQLLVDHLRAIGETVMHTQEPAGTVLGSEIRSWIQQHPASPETMWLLFTAARQHHLDTVIRPALMRGEWVVCDRYFESTYAYQGAMGIPNDALLTLHELTRQSMNIHHQFLFIGKIGVRNDAQQDALDRFCDEKRQLLTNRFIDFSKKSECPTTLINMRDQSMKAIHQEILKTLNLR